MGKAQAIGSATGIGKGATGGGTGAAPGIVSGIAVAGFINPQTLAITLTVSLTPPSDGGDTITAGHLYLEVPDQSAGATYTIGTNTIGDGSTPQGPWAPIDGGVYPIAALAAGVTVTIPGPPGINANVNIASRLYVQSVSASNSNPLVRANQAGATPNQTFTLVSLASGTSTSGTNITGLTIAAGGPVTIVANALAPQNVNGKLETPVEVLVADTPVISGWCYQLVVTYAGQDPAIAANQFVVTGLFPKAGPVPAAVDGISIPHSFVIQTPTVVTNAFVWLQAGPVNAAGIFQGNNIVPGITPSFPIEFGSTVGTTDASAIMTATIAASMAVVDGLFGVAAAGITNSLLGSGAVATINVQALAITNPLLASLAVEAANLATGSVTSTAIGAAAVGTAAIQTAAITTLLVANAAISGAQIQSATITGANIASATIAGANIGTATIAQANMASASIGNAQLQSASVYDANIVTCSVGKLTAGTISATISITSPTITCTNGFEVTAGGLTTTISNGTYGGLAAGMVVDDGSFVTTVNGGAVSGYTEGAAADLFSLSGRLGSGQLTLYNATHGNVVLPANAVATSASSGSYAIPTTAIGFWEVTIGGTTCKIPLLGL